MRKAGAPKGNINATHDKPWTNALNRALLQYTAKGVKAGQALRVIADGVVRDAIAGDPVARREVFERQDGKPVQPVAATVDANITLQVIRFGSDPDPK